MTIRGACLAIAATLAGWVGVLAAVTLLSDEAPAVLVMFPSQDFLADMPEGVAVLSATPASVTLASDETDLARNLYRHGAWLVLPAGLLGCDPRPSADAARTTAGLAS